MKSTSPGAKTSQPDDNVRKRLGGIFLFHFRPEAGFYLDLYKDFDYT